MADQPMGSNEIPGAHVQTSSSDKKYTGPKVKKDGGRKSRKNRKGSKKTMKKLKPRHRK